MFKGNMENKQIRAIYLYEFKLSHRAAEANRNINLAFGEGTTTERTVQRWFKRFSKGDQTLEDKEGCGRRSSINNDELKALVEANTRATVRDLAKELGVTVGTISTHLKEIGKSKKLDKWVPHDLNENQKNRRFELASSHILRNSNDPFLDRIVTTDEKWIMYDNRRRSAQWLDRDQSPKHFAKRELHQKKLMVTVWWSARGLIHHNFLKPGESITAELYCKQIEEMHLKLQEHHPALVNRKRAILLHDNARPHVAKLTLQKLNELGYEILQHPAYSPDLSPSDYHFFKHLDHFLRDRCFKNEEDAKNTFNDFIASRTQEFYDSGIKTLVSRWTKCIQANGEYFD